MSAWKRIAQVIYMYGVRFKKEPSEILLIIYI